METFETFVKDNKARFDEIVQRVGTQNPERLRSCQATIFTDGTDYVLMSYRTIVAAYDFSDNALFVNGYYSPTTQQQISKFIKDVCPSCLRYNLYINSRRIVMYDYPNDTNPVKVNSHGILYDYDMYGNKCY